MCSLLEALKLHVADDHKRGCQGREYKCDCRYDEKTDDLLREATKYIQELERQVEMLSEFDDNA